MSRTSRISAARPTRLLAAALAALLTAAGLTAVSQTVDLESASAAAAPAFDCAAPRFFAQAGDNANTQLYTGTYNADGSTTWTALGANQTTFRYNALAFNPVDEYLYATRYGNAGTQGQIVRIDRTGTVTDIGNSNAALGTPPNTLWDSGVFDPAGTYYVANGNAAAGTSVIYKITGLPGTTAASATRPARTTLNLSAAIRVADLTYKDGYLWGANYSASQTIYRINPTSGVVDTFAQTALPTGSYGSAFTMINGNLAFVGTASLQYQIKVTNPTSATPTFSLVNQVSAPTNSFSDATNCATTPEAHLSVDKSGPAKVVAGQPITWTIAITNSGPGVSSGFNAKDVVPAGVTNITVDGAGSTCTVTGQNVNCNGGSIAVGATKTITITATAPTAIGTIINSATVVGNEDPTERTDTQNTDVTAYTVTGQPVTIAPPKPVKTTGTAPNPTTFPVTTQQGGSATYDGTNLVYTPPANFSGYDQFTYIATDGSTVTVFVTVNPVANPDSGTTYRNVAKTFTAASLLANDLPNTGLTITSVGTAVNGTVSLVGGNPVFTPANNYVGNAGSFNYTVTDANGLTSTTTVTVNVLATPAAPVANADTVSTVVNTAANITKAFLLSNDTGTSPSFTSFTQPSHGAVVDNGSGTLVYTPSSTGAGYSGPDSFTYTITDAAGQTAIGTVNITVTPKANDDSATAVSGIAKNITVLGNDNGTSLSVTAKTNGANGTVAITGTGAGNSVTYTPNANFSGSDTFTYTATDASNQTTVATVTVTVSPDAIDDTVANAPSGSATSINALSNDHGSGLTITGVTTSASTHGTVSVVGTGVGNTLSFTPDATFSGTATFTYDIRDSSNRTDTATVTVNVVPDANDDSDTATSGVGKTISVLGNDTGANKSVTAVTPLADTNGTVSLSGGVITYTPAANFVGTAHFQYTLTGTGGTDTATVTVVVSAVPTDAVDDPFNATTGQLLTITKASLLANDTGTNITFVSNTTNVAHGTLGTDGSGNITYTSTNGYVGDDTFQYTITGPGGTDTATVTIHVAAIPVVAANDSASTNEGQQISIPTSTLLANDTGSPKTFTQVNQTTTAHGTVSVSGGNVIYTPTAGYVGTDTFTYTITGVPGQTSTATVTVTIAAIPAAAVADSASTDATVAVTIPKSTLLANDTGSNRTITSFTNGAHGTVADNGAGGLVYTPSSAVTANGTAWSGTDTFSYTITATGGSTSTTTVTVVTRPDAKNDTSTTIAGVAKQILVLGNDLGQNLTVTSKTNGSNGTVSIAADGKSVTWTPTSANFSGTDTFTYTITGDGGTDTATVTITVAPDAVDDPVGNVLSGVLTTIPVLVNDKGQALTVTAVHSSASTHGTIAVTGDSLGVTFTGDATYSGPASFTYDIAGTGGTDTATVTLTVLPVAVADTANGASGVLQHIDVLANDRGTKTGMTISAVTPGANTHGTVAIVAGKVDYTPDATFTGSATFQYTLQDANGATSTATVTVQVGPVAVDDSTSTAASTPVLIDVLANDKGTAANLTITSVSNLVNGSVVIAGDGKSLTYTPSNGFSGSDGFDYTISDGNGGTSTAHVTVAVAPAPPHAVNDALNATSGSPLTITPGDLTGNDTGTYTLDPLTSPYGQVSHGTLTLVGTGPNYTYTSASDFSGTDTFTYRISGPGGSDTATVTITVKPAAVNDTASTTAGAFTNVDVLANDRGAQLTVVSKTNGANGTVQIIGTGVGNSVRYTPTDPDFSGTDTFTYTIKGTGDGAADSHTATVTVTVAPDAVNDTFPGALSGSQSAISVLTNDHITGITSLTVATGANTHGTAVVSGNQVLYTPDADFSGRATFTYTITGAGGSDTATVTVDVLPVAIDDERTTPAVTPITIPVLGNDNGSSLVLTSVTSGANTHGTVTRSGNSAVYTPAAGFSGDATFTYLLTGAAGTGTATSPATVTVHVTPVAQGDVLVTDAGAPKTIDPRTNDDATGATITATTDGGHGTVTFTGTTVTYTPTDPEYSGTDSFTYTVTAAGGTTTGTVSVTLVPVAVNDTATVRNGSSVDIDVTGNDHGSGTKTASNPTTPSHGTVAVQPSGEIRYTATDVNYSGTDSFTYTLTANGGTDTAVVTITIQPDARNDSAPATSGIAAPISVLGNDHGSNLTVTGATDGTHGTVTVVGTGVGNSVSYLPANDFSGTDTFTYAIAGAGGTDTATVTVTVAPDALNDTVTGAVSGQPITIAPLANDHGSIDRIQSVATSAATHGTVTIAADGQSVEFTPSSNFSGSATFTYTLVDVNGVTDTATVTVTVGPRAVDDEIDAIAGQTKTFPATTLSGNDAGSSPTVTSVTSVSGGTVSLSGGTVTFTPAPGFSGDATFTYTVSDGTRTSTGTVTVHVAPDAKADAAPAAPGIPATIDVLANDEGADKHVTGITAGPSHGSVQIAADGLSVEYTADTGYSGTDTFTYELTGTGGVDTAVVTITVGPVAVDDTATVDAASASAPTSVAIPVLANDHAAPATRTVSSIVTAPAHGTVTITGGGTGVSYAPATGFSGTDTFEYRLSAPGGSDIGLVTVTVAPVANNDTGTVRSGASTSVNVTTNDVGVNKTVTDATLPVGTPGTVSTNGTSVSYAAPVDFSGTAVITYTLSGDGGSDTATLTITVRPDAIDDPASTTANAAVTTDVVANDRGANLSLSPMLGTITHGTATVSGDSIVFTPATNFSGTATVVYTLNGDGGTDTATLTITVAPTAANDTLLTRVNATKTIDPRLNDRGTQLQIVDATDGAHGQVTFTATGVTYVPDAGYSGTDVFSYTVADADGQEVIASVSVTVTPAAADDAASTAVNTAVEIDVVANDTGSNPAVTDLSDPAHGTVVLQGDGTVLYTPDPDWSGIDEFDYTSEDDANQVAGGHVTVTVSPSAVNDSASTGYRKPITVDVAANDHGTSLRATAATLLSGQGTVTITSDGRVKFTPKAGFSGPAVIRYTVTDADGLTAQALLTIEVAPAAVDDSRKVSSTEPTVLDLTGNDNGSQLTVISVTQPKHGTVVLGSDGTVTYIPEPGYTGTVTFQYTVEDEDGQLSTATVTLQVSSDPGGLAFTGSDLGGTIGLALLALLGGIAAVVISRRRNPLGRHRA